MPFVADPAINCANCPYGECIEDRRVNRVANRNTEFRLKQATILGCTFDSFVPGCDSDPMSGRAFDEYIGQMRVNSNGAGTQKYGAGFKLAISAVAKVEGDVFELLEAAALWNAAAAWNRFMDSGLWASQSFTQPVASIATPARKIAIVKLPRGYDTIRLFKPEVQATIRAFEHAMQLADMTLGLSSPDIVGVRLPHPLPPGLAKFLVDLPNLNAQNAIGLEDAYRCLEGQLDSSAFLLAIAVKRTTRSDRLYQPLYEATVLKFLIEYVLRGAAFRFYAHLGSYDGANVIKAYKSGLLTSLIRGGMGQKAVDQLYHAVSPRATAQSILDDLPKFPI
ncbi:Cfr10I/Bse634I family restriction endonuclease [Lysobacter enzymogenes]|uniref:Cfr10I/Bse634I family restriction endonuclease n=1 Tax=Lysobacter enzymogenes TaxID=69 RepID=UPI001AF073DA|nr:Cfr10I/Bse634I family restriction endonuclease [Lysobacter enzymogenes]QQQ01282.1 Cfr10I/Bse634I family restriction endonuclease [Lysobacter enzymogenes]